VISVLLPTVRPDNLPAAIRSIPEAAAGIDYEVIVVADFGPDSYPRTKWIVDERKGPIDAIETAYQAAQGEYVFVFNDESKLEPGSLRTLYEAALTDPWRVLTPYHVPPFTFVYYGRPFAAFPFVRRDVIEDLGGLFDPAYKGFYADPDFSMRAHAKRIPVEVIQSAVIRHVNHSNGQADIKHANWAKWFANDQALFRTRWDHLGAFHDP